MEVAEGEGFEPSKRYNRLRDFQSRALGQAMRPFRDSLGLAATLVRVAAGRRGWDSNPRWLNTKPIFEIGTFNHSDTSPSSHPKCNKPPIPIQVNSRGHKKPPGAASSNETNVQTKIYDGEATN